VAEKKNKSRRLWPLGLLATGVAGTAVMILRGCWHSKMSWPIRMQEHSYQVCLGCGIKRLFDEKNFRAFGPYSYDLSRLVAWDQSRREGLRVVAESAPAEVSAAKSSLADDALSADRPVEHRSAS
jgi:hypothetical protein